VNGLLLADIADLVEGGNVCYQMARVVVSKTLTGRTASLFNCDVKEACCSAALRAGKTVGVKSRPV